MNPRSLYAWYRNTLRNPKARPWIILGTLAYLLSPLDISPDVIPILGQIDDVAILAIFVSEVSSLLFDALRRPQSTATPAPAEGGDTAAQTVDVEAVSVE